MNERDYDDDPPVDPFSRQASGQKATATVGEEFQKPHFAFVVYFNTLTIRHQYVKIII